MDYSHFSNFQRMGQSKRQLSPLRFYHQKQDPYQSPLQRSPFRKAPMSPLRNRNSQHSKSPSRNNGFYQNHFYRSPTQIYEDKKVLLPEDYNHVKAISVVRTSGKGLFQRLIEENKIGSEKKEIHIQSAHVNEGRRKISQFELYEKSERKYDKNIFLNVKQAQSFHRVQSNISFSSNNNNLNTYLQSTIKAENNNQLNSNVLQSFRAQSKVNPSTHQIQQREKRCERTEEENGYKQKERQKGKCKSEEKPQQKIRVSENKIKQIEITQSDENIMDLLKKASQKVCLVDQSTDEKQNVRNSIKQFTFSFNMNPFL